MKHRILIVEDEQSILNLLKEVLKANGYIVDVATDGLKGYELFNKHSYDLVMTDLMMPNMDGNQLVNLIRKANSNIPILMLTALSEEHDEVRGFDLGADDYVTKPFSINVLLKRVQALLKRNIKINHVLEYEKLELDVDAYTVKYDNKIVEFTLKEFEILKYLMENENRVVTRDTLIERIWGYDYYGDTRNVDTHIKNIRKKLPINNIKTVKGLGYNFVV